MVTLRMSRTLASLAKRKPLVLIVDDDRQMNKLLSYILAQDGFKCITASTGRACVEALGARRPDLLLLDLRLPDMDGFKLLSQIRLLSSIPIIVVSALSDSQQKIRALELGADAYLSKPFGYGELLARTRALMRRLALGHWERSEKDEYPSC